MAELNQKQQMEKDLAANESMDANKIESIDEGSSAMDGHAAPSATNNNVIPPGVPPGPVLHPDMLHPPNMMPGYSVRHFNFLLLHEACYIMCDESCGKPKTESVLFY